MTMSSLCQCQMKGHINSNQIEDSARTANTSQIAEQIIIYTLVLIDEIVK